MATRLRDVAERAGVSVKTVSNVVNDFPHVRPEMRARVQAVIDELGYKPNLTARQLRRGRTGMIALALPDLSVPYFAELASQVLRAAEGCGLTLLIEQTGGDRNREVLLTQGPRATSIDGLILSPASLEAADLSSDPAPTPLVLLGERAVWLPADHVAIDNVAAAREAVLHLAKRGRRRVALVGARDGGSVTRPGNGSASAPANGSAAQVADLRTRGYRSAVVASGLARDDGLVVGTTSSTRRDGYAATRRLIESGVRPDAILCLNDLLALGTLRALADLGVRCPEDVAVVGVDGIEDGAFAVPSLTTISPDKQQIAEAAVQLLGRRIEAKGALEPVQVRARHRLEVRESSGAAAG